MEDLIEEFKEVLSEDDLYYIFLENINGINTYGVDNPDYKIPEIEVREAAFQMLLIYSSLVLGIFRYRGNKKYKINIEANINRNWVWQFQDYIYYLHYTDKNTRGKSFKVKLII